MEPTVRATIIMTQRERFDLAGQTIESLYNSTQIPFNLIYVDGGSSPRIRRESEILAAKYNFDIIRREHFLPPNVARNLAINAIMHRAEYIVFVDNDVVFEQEWLEALLQCADETGAALVTPLIMTGNPNKPESIRIHFAGGTIKVKETAEAVYFRDSHNCCDKKLDDLEESLYRKETDFVEFHVALIRSDILEKIGPLDEDLRATSEHLDLSLLVAKLGEKIYFEPDSVVTYILGVPLSKHECEYFMVRWSDYWALHSEQHFQAKWDIVTDSSVIDDFVTNHRLHAFTKSHKRLERVLGYRYSRKVLFAWYSFRVESAKKKALPDTVSC